MNFDLIESQSRQKCDGVQKREYIHELYLRGLLEDVHKTYGFQVRYFLRFEDTAELNSRHLKRHERIHKCSICDKSFGLKMDRDRHRLTHSTNTYKFMCKFPGCKFKGTPRKDYLLKHMHTRHEISTDPASKKSIQRTSYSISSLLFHSPRMREAKVVSSAEAEGQM
jgi:hypothetical protein